MRFIVVKLDIQQISYQKDIRIIIHLIDKPCIIQTI